jgi:glycosyltransferase involved in cell wall biosynthesis
VRVAIVAPDPGPGVHGGAERAIDGLRAAIEAHTPHDASVVKLPVDETTLVGIVAAYRAFADLDVSAFDRVITMKYPAWMVAHPRHTLLMFHPLRGLYDTYHVFGLPHFRPPDTREVGDLQNLIGHWHDRLALTEFFDAFDETVRVIGADHVDLAFPGPFSREVVRWLDRIALAPPAVERHLALSRTVASRPDYFPPGIDPQVVYLPGDLGPPPEPGNARTHLFTASRLDGPKRLDLLVDAMAHVPGDLPLKIAGTGPRAADLAARAAHDPRIELLGFVPDHDLPGLYAGAVAVPFVPEDEDLGLVTLEAFSQATPVITCIDSGGPTELVADGLTGLVADPTPASLGRALARLAANPAWAADLGRAGLRRGRRVTWEGAVAAILGPDAGPPDGDAPATGDALAVSPTRPATTRRTGRGARPKVVVTATFRIDEPRHGGQLRCRHLSGGLALDADVEVLCLVDTGIPASRTELAPGLTQIVVPRSPAHTEAAHELTQAVNMPVTDIVAGTHIWASPAYLDALATAARGAEAVLLAEPYLLPAVDLADLRTPTVYDAYNVEAALKAAALPDTRAGRAMLAEVESVERSAVLQSAAVTACSQADADALAQRYGRDPAAFTVIPNGTEVPATVVSPEERRRLGARWRDRFLHLGSGGRRFGHLAVFFGSWHPPNLDAVELLAEVAGELPDVAFLSVGSHGEAFRHRVFPPNLIFPGTVTDRVKSKLLDAADLAVNPMRTGSGTNLKLIEYLAVGIPVVSTPFGARGVEVVDGTHLLLVEPDRFASGVADALADPIAAATRAVAGRELAARGYAWSTLGHRLAGVLAEVAGGTVDHVAARSRR